MKRTFLKAGAALGVVSVAVLAAGPAIAAGTFTQSTAQSLILTIGGTPAITQKVTATNDGTKETANNSSTIPNLAGVLPQNTLTGVGVAPAEAHALSNGNSYACAGIAGTGSGIAEVGEKSCNITSGTPVTIGLGNLNLGSVGIDPATALGGLDPVISAIIQPVQANLISAISSALAGTPLDVQLGGTLSAIASSCQATPTAASGTSNLAASAISATLGGQTVNLITLPAQPAPNTPIVTNLAGITQILVDDVKAELNGLASGPLAPLSSVTLPVGTTLQTIQDQIIAQVVAQLKPLTDQLNANVLSGTLNKQVVGDNGRSITVTALDLQVLPAAQQFTGSSLVSGQVGQTSCGPNTLATKVTPTPTPTPTKPPGVPTGIDSGLAGGNNTATIIAAMSVLLAAGGAAGTAAYRRYWMPRG
ncbi:MAG: hypothetical protein ACTHOG_12550 [Marmoricola sp.]